MIGWLKHLWKDAMQSPIDSPRLIHKIIYARIVFLVLIWLGTAILMLTFVVLLVLLRLP
jgi:hypothetical protein